jgi:flavin reductase
VSGCHTITTCEFLDGMRRFASSVCVVTTADAGRRHGITVTSLASVSVEPPTLLVCIRRDSPSAAAIQASGVFCVNLLSEGSREIAHLFSGACGGTRHLRFDRVDWSNGRTGCPVLAGSVNAFECRLEHTAHVATHCVFFAAVVGIHRGGGAPLLYADRAYRRLADAERQA